MDFSFIDKSARQVDSVLPPTFYMDILPGVNAYYIDLQRVKAFKDKVNAYQCVTFGTSKGIYCHCYPDALGTEESVENFVRTVKNIQEGPSSVCIAGGSDVDLTRPQITSSVRLMGSLMNSLAENGFIISAVDMGGDYRRQIELTSKGMIVERNPIFEDQIVDTVFLPF